MIEQVWYVSYGSHMLSESLLAALQGGPIPGGHGTEPGCRDQAPPQDERAVIIPHPLYFASRSPKWQGSAVAFIDSEAAGVTYGRAWLLSTEQCADMIRMVNGTEADSPVPFVNVPSDLASGAYTGLKGPFGRLLQLGALEGKPLLTITSAKPFSVQACRIPQTHYLQICIAGLRECFNLSKQAIRKYLKDCPGIAGAISGGAIERLYLACSDNDAEEAQIERSSEGDVSLGSDLPYTEGAYDE